MATPKFVNDFMVGADPEMVVLDPPTLINAQGLRRIDPAGFFGFDHGGFVVEPHPKPNRSVREVCKNLRSALDYLHYQFPNYKFRAGAHINSPQRIVTLGGHVHLDIRDLTTRQIKAMDVFTQSLENLDILPTNESLARVQTGIGYGRKGDVRAEHGHVEYRSMCSWLFNAKTATLCMTGIKLAAVAPETLPEKAFQSKTALVRWLEGFKESDDDVRWMFDKDYFSLSLQADPDASVKTAWKTSEERGKALGEIYVEAKIAAKAAEARVQARRRREAARIAAVDQANQAARIQINQNNW